MTRKQQKRSGFSKLSRFRYTNKRYLVFDAIPPSYYGYKCYVGAVRLEDRDALPAHVRHLVEVTATNKQDAIDMARADGRVGCKGRFAPTRLR
jgi:hypothetical protein